ncbi:MAG: DUF5615 family PIN-like protein, partial [Nanoarchaeota archaeon]
DFLKNEGYDALYVYDIMPRAPDIDVIKFAEKEKRILITNDKDFGELVFKLKIYSPGVIFLRLKSDNPKKRQEHILYLIRTFKDKLKDSFVVITEGKIRIRRLR